MLFQLIVKCPECGTEITRVLKPSADGILEIPTLHCAADHWLVEMQKLRFERVDGDYNG